jgi:hypothetical protein
MTFEELTNEIIEEYAGLWTRLAHYDTLCKGEFEKIEGDWYVCPKCGTSFWDNTER